MTEQFIIETQDFIDNEEQVLEEIIKTVLPESIKNFLNSKSKRKSMLEKYGDKAFLIPSKQKFPVVDPKTGEYHCGLIYAARIRAKQFSGKKPGYREIANKAEELYKNNKCQNRIHVQIKESGSVIELMDLLNLLE
jgi:hypothetical protein